MTEPICESLKLKPRFHALRVHQHLLSPQNRGDLARKRIGVGFSMDIPLHLDNRRSENRKGGRGWCKLTTQRHEGGSSGLLLYMTLILEIADGCRKSRIMPDSDTPCCGFI